MDQFSENGGGVISDPKNFFADFSIINEHFMVILRGKTMNFRERGGGAKSHLEVFRKLIHFCERNRPLPRNSLSRSLMYEDPVLVLASLLID